MTCLVRDAEIIPPTGYTDLRKIGAGSQATVFSAVKSTVGKRVALKAFAVADSANPPAATEREVDSLVALDGHPNVVGVHDRRWASGHLWLEMDLCTGGSVAEWIAESRASRRELTGQHNAADDLAKALQYSSQAVEALRFAHQHSVLHCDIKPSNLLIDRHSNVRLADFGIAVLEGLVVQRGRGRTGTIGYLAPELEFGPPTQASDVYALGVTIQAMRRVAVPDADLPSTDAPTLTGDNRPVPLNALAAELERLAIEMTEPDPRSRPDLKEVKHRLDVLHKAFEGQRLVHSGGNAAGQPSGIRRISLSIGAALLAVGVVIGLVLLVPRIGPADTAAPPAASPPTASATTAPTVTLATSNRLLVSANASGVAGDANSGRPSLDKSGRFVAFTSAAKNLDPRRASGHFDIYRKDTETQQLYLVSVGAAGAPANGDSQFPAICQDGRYVAFASTSTNLLNDDRDMAPDLYRVYVRDILSDTTFLISNAVGGKDADGDSFAPRFSEDCTEVLFESDATNLVRDDANGAVDIFVKSFPYGSLRLASVNAKGGSVNGSSTHGDISPSGELIAFTSWGTNLTAKSEESPIPQLYVRNLRTSVTIPVSAGFTKTASDIKGFSWPVFSPDGRYLIFRSLTDPNDPSRRGRHVFVWDLRSNRSAITLPDGTPTGWGDACVNGVSNGTNFSPQMVGETAAHPERILFTVPRSDACQLVLRDLGGRDVPVVLPSEMDEVLEPALNASGDVLAWAVSGSIQQIYACPIDDCDCSTLRPTRRPRRAPGLSRPHCCTLRETSSRQGGMMAANVAVISHAGRAWQLREGQSLGYGRRQSRTIRIQDPRVSSTAGVLFVSGGCVWIRHDSASHAITIRPRVGEPWMIPRRPQGSAIGIPQPLQGPGTRLEMIGQFRTIDIDIDSGGLVGPAPNRNGVNSEPAGDAPTDAIYDELTQDERALLAVLAEPLLRTDEGSPRLTKEVALRMGVTYRTVENRLAKLRTKLTGLGVRDLQRDEFISPGTKAGSGFIATLGIQAWAHGWARLEDLPG